MPKKSIPKTEIPIKSGSKFSLIVKVAKRIKKLDFMGSGYNLLVEGNDKYKTKIGGILSIFVVGLSIYLVIQIVRNFFDRSQPKTIISTQVEYQIPKRDLYKQNYPLAFGAYDENNQNILPSELPKYMTGFLEVRELDLSKVGEGEGGAVSIKFIKIFNFIPCVDVKDKTLTDFFLIQKQLVDLS